MDAAARTHTLDRARARVIKAQMKREQKKAKARAKARAKAKAEAEARATTASCELCRGSLDYPGVDCQGVRLTFSCSACAIAARSAEGMLLASQTRAREEFRICQADLGLIGHVTKPNPYNSRSPIKLYVRSELQVDCDT